MRTELASTNQMSAFMASDISILLSEIDPDLSHGAIPVLDQCDALESYRAYDDAGLEAVPEALAAHIDSQQRMWL
jgi:hypothetical protein